MWLFCTTDVTQIKEKPASWDHQDITLPIF